MKNEWKVELDGECFSIVVRPGAPEERAVIYEIDRLAAKRERVGEIHEDVDGTYRTVAYESPVSRQTLEALVSLIARKFHSVTTSLRKSAP